MKNNLVLILCLFLVTMAAAAEETREDQCDENFQKVFAAKRSCILNDNQADCSKLAILSSIYPVVGGIVGALTAKMWNSILEKRTDIPNAKSLMDKIRAVDKAHETANAIADRAHRITTDKKTDFADRIREVIKVNKDPLVVEQLQELINEKPYKSGYVKVLKEHFGDAFDKAYTVQRHQLSIDALNSKERAAYDVLNAVGRNDPGELGFKNVKAAQTEQEKRLQRPKTAAVVGGIVGVSASLAIPIAANIIDKKEIKLCQKELGLSDKDIEILNGNSYFFSGAKAKSSSGVLNLTCSKLKIQGTDETLAQVKTINDGKVSPGICKIMKNEMAEIDSAFESLASIRNTDCSGLKAPNLEISVNESQMNLTYFISSDTKVTAPMNEKGHADYTQATVFINGTEDKSKTVELRQKSDDAKVGYFISGKVTTLKKNSACLDPSETSTDCKLRRASILSGLYYNNYKQNCSLPSNSAPAPVPAKATR